MQFVLESDRILCQSHVAHNQIRKLDSRIGSELVRALLHFKYQRMDDNLDFYLHYHSRRQTGVELTRLRHTSHTEVQKNTHTHHSVHTFLSYVHQNTYPQGCCMHTWSCLPRHGAEVLSRFSQLVFQTKFSHEGLVLKLDTAYLVTCY